MLHSHIGSGNDVVLACGHCARSRARPIAAGKSLRNFVLNEPRGGVLRHVSLLVPARQALALMGLGVDRRACRVVMGRGAYPVRLTNNNYSHYYFFTARLTGSRLRENELNDTPHRQ